MTRVLLLLCAFALVCPADEGMWTYNNFPAAKVKQAYGFEPDAQWLEHVRLSSLRFGNGCSSSFVSPNGLIMTNHHCAVGCVSDLSTPQADLVKNGYYAKSAADEKRCPGLFVNQLVEIRDVTDRISKATKGLEGGAFTKALDAEKSRIEKECGTGETIHCEVVTLYSGGRYDLYRYRRYNDVRLVFAPEKAIAFFGGDPDNFMFPRYDLDVTFLRAYENNAPVKAEHYLKWSAGGAKDGELTFVSGHPGRTSRELTLKQIEATRDSELPEYLMYMSEYRGWLAQFQNRGAEQYRIAETPLFSVENSLKKFKGEFESLVDPRVYAAKAKAEQELRAKVNANPELKAAYGRVWDEIAAATEKEKQLSTPYMYFEKNRGFRSTLYTIARNLVRASEELPKTNDARLPEFADSKLATLKASLFSTAPIYDELEIETLTFTLTKLREELGPDDRNVQAVLGKKSPREIATEVVRGSKLKDIAVRKALFEGGAGAVNAADDAMIRFAKLVDPIARGLRTEFERDVESVLKKNGQLLGRARFAVYGTSIYPDATFTLRLSYGQVKGWEENGRKINPFTIMGGAYERHTGSDPFALPESWLKAKNKLNQTTPMNLVTTNDIIGGNSGSPMINRNAEVIGLIFDGNIHSLGGDFWFDQSLNRAVAVDSRALLESLDKVYGATRVLDELRPAKSAVESGSN